MYLTTNCISLCVDGCTPERFYDFLLTRYGFGLVTVGGYKRVLNKFLKDVETERPTIEMVETYVASLRKRNCSYSHVRNSSVILEKYMAYIGNPIRLGRPRKPKSMVKNTLTEGEIARMLAATRNKREKALISILAYSGIRNKELCSLKPESVSYDSQALQIVSGKGNKDRLVFISRECVKAITEYIGACREKSDYLFSTLQQNKQYTSYALRKLVKIVAGRAGIEKRVYPHLMRHSLACNLLNRGANLMTIKEQLGHQDIKTTMIYARSNPQRIQQEYNFYAPAYN